MNYGRGFDKLLCKTRRGTIRPAHFDVKPIFTVVIPEIKHPMLDRRSGVGRTARELESLLSKISFAHVRGVAMKDVNEAMHEQLNAEKSPAMRYRGSAPRTLGGMMLKLQNTEMTLAAHRKRVNRSRPNV